jgi:hypothetical protein
VHVCCVLIGNLVLPPLLEELSAILGVTLCVSLSRRYAHSMSMSGAASAAQGAAASALAAYRYVAVLCLWVLSELLEFCASPKSDAQNSSNLFLSLPHFFVVIIDVTIDACCFLCSRGDLEETRACLLKLTAGSDVSGVVMWGVDFFPTPVFPC